jgi:hypothetical protein
VKLNKNCRGLTGVNDDDIGAAQNSEHTAGVDGCSLRSTKQRAARRRRSCCAKHRTCSARLLVVDHGHGEAATRCPWEAVAARESSQPWRNGAAHFVEHLRRVDLVGLRGKGDRGAASCCSRYKGRAELLLEFLGAVDRELGDHGSRKGSCTAGKTGAPGGSRAASIAEGGARAHGREDGREGAGEQGRVPWLLGAPAPWKWRSAMAAGGRASRARGEKKRAAASMLAVVKQGGRRPAHRPRGEGHRRAGPGGRRPDVGKKDLAAAPWSKEERVVRVGEEEEESGGWKKWRGGNAK